MLAAALVLVLAAPAATQVSGDWRVLSARLFYDAGGAGALNRGAGHLLELSADGHWTYGTSRGTYSIAPITSADWSAWKIPSYGPTSKLVLSGWNGGDASGPIESSNGAIDFVWVIYRVKPPAVQAPGLVHMRFGRSR